MRVLCLLGLVGCGFSTTVAPDGSGSNTNPAIDGSSQPASCDLDGDGACDDQTWRCGSSPSSPGADPLFGDITAEALWSHDVSLANQGRFVVAAAGKPLALTFRYDWRVDCASTTCQAQVEFGLVASGVDQRLGCVVDREMVDRNIEWSQPGAVTIVAPAASGLYDVRLEIAKQTACGASWATPAGNHTIAKICVP